MLLGVVLEQLQDFENARAAYERALQLDPEEPLFRLNYGEQLTFIEPDGCVKFSRETTAWDENAIPEQFDLDEHTCPPKAKMRDRI